MLRIALVDDHQLFRKGMAALLNMLDDVHLAIEASNGREFLNALPKTKVDLVLLDLKMPVLDGRNTMIELRKNYPDIKIIILTMESGEETILHCIEEGANGFLKKDCHPDEVSKAIQTIQEQGNYISPEISNVMIRGLSDWSKGIRTTGIQINEKEKLVLRGICKQQTTTQIAEELFLSPRTIEGYRRELLEKTGNKNSIGLVLFAAQKGWLDQWMEEE